jgi:hypothetical protein
VSCGGQHTVHVGHGRGKAVGAFGGGLLRAVACCWRVGERHLGLVQRGQVRGAVVVLLCASMSHGPGSEQGDGESTEKSIGHCGKDLGTS